MRRRPCKRQDGHVRDELKGFGDLITFDYVEAQDESNNSHQGHVAMLTVMDVATNFVMAYPVKTTDADETEKWLRHFVGARLVGRFYSDKGGALIAAAEAMKVPMENSKAGRPQTNSIIERCNQDVCRGARTVLVQAGLPPPYWDLAVQHYCHARNIRVSKESSPEDNEEGSAMPSALRGTSAWFEKWGIHFSGQVMPFGVLVDFMPSSTTNIGKEVERRKFQGTTARGMFVGYALGHGNRWTKAYKVVHLATLAGKPLRVGANPRDCQVNVQEVDEVKPVYQTDSEGRMIVGRCIFPCKEQYERVNGGFMTAAQKAAVEGEFRWGTQPGGYPDNDMADVPCPPSQLDFRPRGVDNMTDHHGPGDVFDNAGGPPLEENGMGKDQGNDEK